jgi:hypothetical protein
MFLHPPLQDLKNGLRPTHGSGRPMIRDGFPKKATRKTLKTPKKSGKTSVDPQFFP